MTLSVTDLSVYAGQERLVNNISFTIAPGEVVGVVGESGSGKTLTSLAVADLLPQGLRTTASDLTFQGQPIHALSKPARNKVLGTDLAMVFQDPMNSLNPALRIGEQLTEGLRLGAGVTRASARAAALRALTDVNIDQPVKVMRQFPYELSGGMRQRVMIAMALMHEPALLIADEPTTALDVTVQAQVMDLLAKMNRRRGTAIMMVSHNIALLSEICDRLLVMFRGDLVDAITVADLLAGQGHPYTRMLVQAVPDLHTDRTRPLATIDDLEAGEINGA